MLERVMGYLSERAHLSWNLKSEKMPARQSMLLIYVMPRRRELVGLLEKL